MSVVLIAYWFVGVVEYMLADAGRHRVGGGQTQSVGKGAALAKDSGKSDRGYPSQLGSTSAGSRDQSKGVGAP